MRFRGEFWNISTWAKFWVLISFEIWVERTWWKTKRIPKFLLKKNHSHKNHQNTKLCQIPFPSAACSPPTVGVSCRSIYNAIGARCPSIYKDHRGPPYCVGSQDFFSLIGDQHSSTCITCCWGLQVLNSELVGGFNPFEQYQSRWMSSPGREIKNDLKPPARYSESWLSEIKTLQEKKSTFLHSHFLKLENTSKIVKHFLREKNRNVFHKGTTTSFIKNNNQCPPSSTPNHITSWFVFSSLPKSPKEKQTAVLEPPMAAPNEDSREDTPSNKPSHS